MNLSVYDRELKRARVMIKREPEQKIYWEFYILGLSRIQLGELNVTDNVHENILALKDTSDSIKKQMYDGYSSGLKHKPQVRGPARKLVNPKLISIYLEEKQYNVIPKNGKGKPDQDFLREAVYFYLKQQKLIP